MFGSFCDYGILGHVGGTKTRRGQVTLLCDDMFVWHQVQEIQIKLEAVKIWSWHWSCDLHACVCKSWGQGWECNMQLELGKALTLGSLSMCLGALRWHIYVGGRICAGSFSNEGVQEDTSLVRGGGQGWYRYYAKAPVESIVVLVEWRIKAVEVSIMGIEVRVYLSKILYCSELIGIPVRRDIK